MNNSQCVILVPCNNGIEHSVDTSLRILESRGYEVWRTPGYSAIDQGRNRMAYDALVRRKFQELMWIDSDVAFNPDQVDRIRQHNLPIVGGAYPFKGWPLMTVQLLAGQIVKFSECGKPVEVDCLATGFLYTKAEVYWKIIEQFQFKPCNTSFGAPQYPFFLPGVWDDDYYLGEDFSFCKRARASGYKVMLDPGIKLGHIGKYTYEWEDVVNLTGQRPKQPCSPLYYASEAGMQVAG